MKGTSQEGPDGACGQHTGGAYAAWPNGPPSDPSSFPIGVWLQDPANAAACGELGINVYIGLWEGPELRAVGGRFEDSFAPYDVHLYRMKMGS